MKFLKIDRLKKGVFKNLMIAAVEAQERTRKAHAFASSVNVNSENSNGSVDAHSYVLVVSAAQAKKIGEVLGAESFTILETCRKDFG